MTTLQQAIAEWDGKSADYIGNVFEQHHTEATFVDELIELLQLVSLQKGASWCLKKYTETDRNLDAFQVETIYALLPQLEHWETKLHLLQSISALPIPAVQKANVETFLRECLADKNKFVRAWAYNGFYHLALQHEEYEHEVRQLLEQAMQNEAPSVKARVRNLRQQNWDRTTNDTNVT